MKLTLDWNALTPALQDPTRLPDLSRMNEYRQFLIEVFKPYALKDLRQVFDRYFNQFADSLAEYNAIHFRNQIRLRRKHPAVDRAITYLLNDPEQSKCLKQVVDAQGDLPPCLKTCVDAYFNDQGDDWLLNQFELDDFDKHSEISRPQFIAKFIKLCQSGHRREVWRAIREFSNYVAQNTDLIANDATTWQYRQWLYHNTTHL